MAVAVFFFLDSPMATGGGRRAMGKGMAMGTAGFDLAAAQFCQKGSERLA